MDFRLDVDGVHPQKYCLKCYAIMNSCISRNGKTSVAPILWIPHSINCTTCELRAVKSKGGRPKKKVKGIGGGRPRKGEEKKVITVDDILKFDPSKPVPSSVVKALSYVLTIKMKQSDLPNNTVKLATSGPQPLTVTPIAVARKDSQEVSKRTLSSRTKQSKEIIQMISGSSSEALTTQTSHVVKSFNAESRDVIISKLDHIIKIPPEQMSAMKTCFSLPWNLVREIRRWLGSFKINVASEGSRRNGVNDWVGTGLRTEEIPATVKKSKRSFIVLKPWCYIYNLVGYVLKYMDELKENNLLYDGGIPASEIHLKIGGDHGGQSFKMSFQVANVHNPNKPENSVIYFLLWKPRIISRIYDYV